MDIEFQKHQSKFNSVALMFGNSNTISQLVTDPLGASWFPIGICANLPIPVESVLALHYLTESESDCGKTRYILVASTIK